MASDTGNSSAGRLTHVDGVILATAKAKAPPAQPAVDAQAAWQAGRDRLAAARAGWQRNRVDTVMQMKERTGTREELVADEQWFGVHTKLVQAEQTATANGCHCVRNIVTAQRMLSLRRPAWESIKAAAEARHEVARAATLTGNELLREQLTDIEPHIRAQIVHRARLCHVLMDTGHINREAEKRFIRQAIFDLHGVMNANDRDEETRACIEMYDVIFPADT